MEALVLCFLEPGYETKVDGFSQFGLKTGGYGSCGLALKPLARVSRFGPQNKKCGLVI
jgi:hypothetical protein